MEAHLLQDLAVVMAVAGAMTLVCHHFRQPVVIGYLLAGLLIGPYTPPVTLVSDLKSIHTMAELGLVFLLFSLGLEFSLPKIQRVGLSAGLATFFEVGGMLGIGYALGRAFGWDKMDSIFLGSILCISSTTIIVKVFTDFRMMQEKFVQVVFGILVLEDVVAVAILSILSGLGGPVHGSVPATIALSFLRIGLFVVLFIVGGLLVVPRLVGWTAKFHSKEALGVVTLGICLGGAMLALHFKLSVALGAFLAGAVLAASREIKEIEEWVHPVRDMFSAIFFVSAGMLIQPAVLWQYKGPIVIVTLVTIVGKVLSGAAGSFLAGYDVKTSTRVGMSMAQIGEFSFVIASLGLTLGVTSDFLYPLAVTVSSLTTLATPYLIRHSDAIVDAALNRLPPSAVSCLARYGTWVERISRHGDGTTIFARYLVRLGVYAAVFVAALAVTRTASTVLVSLRLDPSAEAWALAVLWTGVAIACLPLFLAISKYADHIILLVVTRNRALLGLIDVYVFYRFLHAGTMALLSAVFLWPMVFLAPPLHVLSALAMLAVAHYLFRRRIATLKEGLERVLDHVTGLATSEPTRQAVLRSGDGALVLVDITDQVALPEGSPHVGRTVRELGLRERSGASIVAVYRAGQHMANPRPDLALESGDVLVLLGDEGELAAARAILAA